LVEGDLQRRGVVPGLDQTSEPGGAGDVRPLTDHDEVRVRADLEGLQPAEVRAAPPVGDLAGGQAGDGLANGGDVLGPGAAAAAHRVHQTALRELAEQAAGGGGLLVVAAERV